MTVASVSLDTIEVTAAPAAVVIPRLRNARATAFERSSSSSGASQGRASTIVTSAPKDRYIDANSRPTAPAPITTTEPGMRSARSASSLVITRPLTWSPGRSRGAEPVASTMSVAVTAFPPTVSDRSGPNAAAPVSTSIPRCFTSPVTPLTSLSIEASSKAWIADQSGSPAALMPHSEDRSTVSITSADRKSAFVGMQPRSRQVPPRRSSRSTNATRLPSCAARRAAEYPPVPAPITTTS